MLTFFRHLRKRLIESKAIKKYMLYAIGEILLVTVGILLALQINNWNQDRKEYEFESSLLTALRNTIIAEYALIEDVLSGNEQSKNACEILIQHFDQNLPYEDTLNEYFWLANWWWQLNLNHTAFENAKLHGLQFIHDDTLKIQLTRIYDNDTKYLDDIDFRLTQYQFNVVEPYILNLFESTNFGSKMIPHDYELLRKDKKYRTILNTNLGNRIWFENLLKNRILKGLKDIEERIQAEILSR